MKNGEEEGGGHTGGIIDEGVKIIGCTVVFLGEVVVLPAE